MSQETAFAKKEREEIHLEALTEIKAGQKKGHWIWWVFPPLRQCGKDRYTPDRACLDSLQDAIFYLQDPTLRSNLLAVLVASAQVLARHSARAPWHVFDMAFSRQPSGQFVKGPVDSYKVRACCTLFAVAAHKEGFSDVHAACLQVLSFFSGDCAYSDRGSGSVFDRNGDWTEECVPLVGPDTAVLELIGVDEGEIVWGCVPQEDTIVEDIHCGDVYDDVNQEKVMANDA